MTRVKSNLPLLSLLVIILLLVGLLLWYGKFNSEETLGVKDLFGEDYVPCEIPTRLAQNSQTGLWECISTWTWQSPEELERFRESQRSR